MIAPRRASEPASELPVGALSDGEEGRAFLQSRLAQLGRWGLWISLFFTAIAFAMYSLLDAGLVAATCHLMETLVCLLVWLAMRDKPRSFRTLIAVDCLCSWANCGVFIAMGWLLRPNELDGRSDLYALAAVGYFLLTGQPPFLGSSIVEVCGHHLHSTPLPPSEQLGRALPSELEQVLLRCLEKQPERRHASAHELADALLACRDVPAWSHEQARRFWHEQRATIQAAKQRAHEASARASTLVGTVAIDLRARGLAETFRDRAAS
jgi:hypothetical protein